VIVGRIAGHRFPRPKGWELMTFLGGKALFFTLALGIPMLLHSFWIVLSFYAIVSFVQGVVLSVVFQMAHCVEEADFPVPQDESGRMDNAWAVHQVETTVDFARRNNVDLIVVRENTEDLYSGIEHEIAPGVVEEPAASAPEYATAR
jgi:linoleoyl-CoA desaturase